MVVKLMTEKEADVCKKISDWMENVMSPRCPKCNTKLSAYPYYDWNGAFRICPNCKEEVREK